MCNKSCQHRLIANNQCNIFQKAKCSTKKNTLILYKMKTCISLWPAGAKHGDVTSGTTQHVSSKVWHCQGQATPLTSNMRRNVLGGIRRDVTTLGGHRLEINWVFGIAAAECLLKHMFSSCIMWVHFMFFKINWYPYILHYELFICPLIPQVEVGNRGWPRSPWPMWMCLDYIPWGVFLSFHSFESQHPLVSCHLHCHLHWMIWRLFFFVCVFRCIFCCSGNITIFLFLCTYLDFVHPFFLDSHL